MLIVGSSKLVGKWVKLAKPFVVVSHDNDDNNNDDNDAMTDNDGAQQQAGWKVFGLVRSSCVCKNSQFHRPGEEENFVQNSPTASDWQTWTMKLFNTCTSSEKI